MFDITRPWPIKYDRGDGLFLALGVLGILVVLHQLDVPASLWAQSWPQLLRDAFLAITDLGKSDWILIPALVILLLSVLGILVLKGFLRHASMEMAMLAGFFFAGIAGPGLAASIIKRLIGRGRPEVLDASGALDFQSIFNDAAYQSFPSGHTTTAFAMCFVLSFLLPRLLPWMLVLALTIGLSRIVVGVHYPTDVFGGFLVGTFGAYAVRNFFAARGWLFEFRDDGTIHRRPLPALTMLARRRS